MDIPADLVAALAGRYEIVRELGRGGMATVYVARDLRHNRDVALKVMSRDLGPTMTDRFTREIELTARLSHPHILPLLDSGRAADSAFYVMPLADASLHALLAEQRELPIDDALRIAIDVADALDYAHRSGIVHRDIKPENILLQHGRPVVADFGIARLRDEAATQLTATGVSIGTPLYMSPEQVSGERAIDGRADVYALGCVLFELLTGAPPFAGPNPRVIMARHASDAPPSIRSVRPAVSPALERVVHRAMAKVPADRFATAGELRDALSAAAARPASRQRLPLAALITAAAVVFVFVAVWAGRRNRDAVVQEGAAVARADSSRIAVLPMANLGGDTTDDYFAAGMTDEMISTLSDIGGLRVIARSAVVRYASSTKPLDEVGRELGVGSIIESTLRKEGRRLRIGVRLVDARTQEQRWSQQYDRELADMFQVQREIARRVADALRVQMRGRDTTPLAQVPSRNAEAMDLYIRARQLEPDAGAIPRAKSEESIALLRRAIALDGNFALAHALLGQRYANTLFNYEPGPKYRALAMASIERALELDPNLPEAYQARGDLEYTPEAGWRYEAALRDYQRAIALRPSLSTAHAKLGVLLMHMGIYGAALRELETSLMLDPFDRFARVRVGRVLWQSQRFDSALSAFEHGADIVAEHALVLGYVGRATDGLAFLDSARRQNDIVDGDIAAARSVLYARLGRTADADREMRIGATTNADRAHFHHAAFSLATANALLGRNADALRWLKVMAGGGMPAYELIAGDPVIAQLRGDPDFEAFVRQERARYQSFVALATQR